MYVMGGGVAAKLVNFSLCPCRLSNLGGQLIYMESNIMIFEVYFTYVFIPPFLKGQSKLVHCVDFFKGR